MKCTRKEMVSDINEPISDSLHKANEAGIHVAECVFAVSQHVSRRFAAELFRMQGSNPRTGCGRGAQTSL